MKSTGYDDSRTLVPGRASGYSWEGRSFANTAYLNMAIPFSAGALYSTVEDLLVWDRALYTDKLVSRKSLEEMFTPFKQMMSDLGYAYGWGVGRKFNRQLITHNGGINGFSTNIMRFPDDRTTVIVLSNNEGTSADKVANDPGGHSLRRVVQSSRRAQGDHCRARDARQVRGAVSARARLRHHDLE